MQAATRRAKVDSCARARQQLRLLQQSEGVLESALDDERKHRWAIEEQLASLTQAAKEAEEELMVVSDANAWLRQDERRQVRDEVEGEKELLEERIVQMQEEAAE